MCISHTSPQPFFVDITYRFGTESPDIQSKAGHSFVRTPPHIRHVATGVKNRSSHKAAQEPADNESGVVGRKSDGNLKDVEEYAAKEEDVFPAVILGERSQDNGSKRESDCSRVSKVRTVLNCTIQLYPDTSLVVSEQPIRKCRTL